MSAFTFVQVVLACPHLLGPLVVVREPLGGRAAVQVEELLPVLIDGDVADAQSGVRYLCHREHSAACRQVHTLLYRLPVTVPTTQTQLLHLQANVQKLVVGIDYFVKSRLKWLI